MTISKGQNDDQIEALARDKALWAQIEQLAKEFTAMQAEYQVWRAEFLVIQAENSRILDRLERGREGQE